MTGQNITLTSWTEEQDAYIRQSYRNIPAIKIGEFLGKTKGAIIGRANRIGLGKPYREVFPGTPAYVRPKSVKRLEDGRSSLFFRLPKMNLNSEVEPLNGSGLKIWELKDKHCRWVVGEPSDLTYCGHDQHTGSSYCPSHFALSIRKTK
jgi:hypothetical protein